MKSVYNALKEPITHYLKKDILNKEGIRAVGVLTQKFKALEIEDNINISSNKELCKEQVFTYKPSILQQKINNDFNYTNRFKLNNSNQFGLSSILYRPFSTKVNTMKNIDPRIQIGGDFAKLVTESTAFVDKSLFIKEIFHDSSEAILITMPRRWGKSANIDMLKRFLEIIPDQNGLPIKAGDKINQLNYKLFFGGTIEKGGIFGTIHLKELDIAQKDNGKYSDLQGQYPVIYIDFKDCTGNNYAEVMDKLKARVIDLYKEHGYLSKSEKIIDEGIKIKDQYIEDLGKIKSGEKSVIEFSLKSLSKLISKHFDKKVWILVDEYDSPLNAAFIKFGKNEFSDGKFTADGDFQKTINLFRSIMSPALKGNENLEKSILTGVLSSAQSSMLSGLNNVKHHSVLSNKFAKYYGFNTAEVKELSEHFNVSEISLLSKISNGYRYGDVEGIYNTWSTANYLNDKEYTANIVEEWTKSGGFDLVEDIILKNVNDVQSSLNQLVSGEPLNIEIKPDIEYSDLILGKIDTVMSTLLWTGYLTPTIDRNIVRIPNQPVKQSIQNQINKWVEKFVAKEEITDIFSYLDTPSIFEEKLKTAFMNSSFYDLSVEKDYHNVMNGMLNMLPRTKYLYLSNRESGRGRFDNILYNKQNKTGYILEYKHEKEATKGKKINIADIQNEAINQAKMNRYDEYLKTHHIEPKAMKLIVVVFHGKVPHVRYESYENNLVD